MKTLCTIPAVALAASVLMAGLCPASSVPTEWTVRIGPRSAAYQAERRHGDALALKASLVYNGQPLAYSGPARLYAQTNGMGDAWWDLAPCTVSSNILEATWLPSFDTGADVVDLFLGGPSNYQAAARIRFLPSPGAAPNALPLPVPVLDFATVTITNAPFALESSIDYTTSNTQLVATIEATASVPGNYEAVSNAAMNARSVTDLGVRGAPQGDGSWFMINDVKIEYAGEGMWSSFDYTILYVDGYFVCPQLGGAPTRFVLDSKFEHVIEYDDESYLVIGYTSTLAQVSQIPDTNTIVQTAVATSSNYTDAVAAEFGDGTRSVAVANHATSSTFAQGSAHLDDGIGNSYSVSALIQESTNAAKAVVAPVATSVGVVWSLVYGGTAWFAVTNYLRTADGVMPSMQFWEVRDGVTNLVYSSAEEIGAKVEALRLVVQGMLGVLGTSLSNRVAGLEAAMPSKAWSRYQSATGAEAPDGVTVISTPTTMLSANYEWQRYVDVSSNSVWLLQARGVTVLGADSNQFFRVSDDDGNVQFEVSTTASQLVPAYIAKVGFTAGNFEVTCPVNVQPKLFTAYSLAGPWSAEGDDANISVTWASVDGAWKGTVLQSSAADQLFVKTKYWQEGETKVVNRAPVEASGGIYCTDGIHKTRPVYVPGGSVSWEVLP